MTSRIGSRLPRSRRPSWPARSRAGTGTAAGSSRLLTAARWRRLSSYLGAERRIAEAVLTALATGNPWNETVRGSLREWMLDGRWVEFWGAYVSLLSPRESARWRRALSRPGDPRQRAWRLVSARLLLDRV